MTQLLKKVLNSDPGDADHFGGDDLDIVSDYFNNVNLSPRDPTIDTLTLFKANKLTAETMAISRGSISTVGRAQTSPFSIAASISTTDATTAQDYATLDITTQYTASNITDPFDLGSNGLQLTLNYGVSPAARAAGSALARTTLTRVLGSGGTTPANNEIANDMGWMKLVAGEICSAWYTDWSLQGSVAAQPGMLSGINMVVNNYYNGSPSRNGSYGIGIVTKPESGGGQDAEHLAATSYKLDMGMAIQGYAGTLASPTRGIEIGLQIGGNNTNWMGTSLASKIGTGIKLTDMESIGIDLDDPGTAASSPIGISVTTTTRTWDTFLDLSGGLAPTTTAIKLGDRDIRGATVKQYNVAANTWDFWALASTVMTLRLVPNIGTVSTNAQRSVLQLLNINTGTEALTLRAAGTDGYNIIADSNGGGSARPMNFYMGANLMLQMKTDSTWDFNNRTTINQIIQYKDVTKVNTDSPYAIATTDRIIRANATSGALTVTLPTAVGVTGKRYTIRRVDILASSVLVTVATTSSQTISTAPAWYLWPAEFVEVESDGANWEVIHASETSAFQYHLDKGATDSRYYVAGETTNVALLTSTTSPAANTLWAMPLFVPKVTKFDTLLFNVTTTGVANARVGIYRDNGNSYPGAMIFDSGNIDCSSGTTKSTTITSGVQVFPPGLYWLAWEVSAATIQIRCLGATGLYGLLGHSGTFSANPPCYGWTVTHTVGTLPDPYTAGGTALFSAPAGGNPIPAVGIRAL